MLIFATFLIIFRKFCGLKLVTYKIKDLNDEIIKGIFYEKELQKTRNTSDEYIIGKILKTNKNKMYVKWREYSNNFNSWIDKNSVTKYI